MSQAADQGVLLVSLGTIAQLGELRLSSSATRYFLKHVCAHFKMISVGRLHMPSCFVDRSS